MRYLPIRSRFMRLASGLPRARHMRGRAPEGQGAPRARILARGEAPAWLLRDEVGVVPAPGPGCPRVEPPPQGGRGVVRRAQRLRDAEEACRGEHELGRPTK